MLVIANKKIPAEKKLSISLTYIYGVGYTIAKKILQKTQIEDKKSVDLSQDEINKIVKELENYTIEAKLREEVQKKKQAKIRLGTYQGRRLEKGLPVHGQSTRRNAQTAKKKGERTRVRTVVAGKKRAPSPK